MSRIFISHASADRSFVQDELLGLLQALKFDPWFAPDDVHTSQDWERAILQGLRQSDWMLLVMSPDSAASQWVKDEVAWAADNRLWKLVPILLRDCNPMDFHIRLPRIQYIDFRTKPNKGREELIKLLVTTEYAPESQSNLLNGLLRCPSKEILTLVRVESDDTAHTHTLIGQNLLAEEFYGRRKGVRLRGTPLMQLFDETLKQWMNDVDFKAFLEDQTLMMEALSRGEEIFARVPMRINDLHPGKNFRGHQYFPIVIAYSNPVYHDGKQVQDGLVLYVELDQLPTAAEHAA